MQTIHLKGNTTDYYTDGTLEIDTGNDTQNYSCRLKCRGQSAKAFEKKSFSIKLQDEAGAKLNASLLGLRNDNTWILDAAAVDASRIRNRVSFDLWHDFACTSFVQRDFDATSEDATRGTFVELVLNDDYHGIYCLSEKLDRKQLALKKYKNGVRGILYKARTWEGTTFEQVDEAYCNDSAMWMGWESIYPDVEEDGETDWRPLVETCRFIVNATPEVFARDIEERIDVPVVCDLELLLLLTNAVDNFGKNTFCYFYNAQKSRRMGFAPWDLDATWGRSYDGSFMPAERMQPQNNLMKRLARDLPGYAERQAARWFELRTDAFDAETLKGRFHTYFELFRTKGIVAREAERWQPTDASQDSAEAAEKGMRRIPLDFDAEEAYINGWIDQRLAVLDAYFAQRLQTK